MTEQDIKRFILPKAKAVIDEVKKSVIGKDDIIIKVLLAVIAKGHILLDDIPGVGKTTLALGFSRAMSLECKRMQFTPDVMPADVTGFNIYNRQKDTFEYKEGAAVCNLFLADEINRTSSKTQSALLEVMEEGAVTVDGVTHILPKPYIVIATQNPIGSVGTQMLPDSQLDRFIIRLSMGYPDIESEIEIMKSKSVQNELKNVVERNDIIDMQNAADEIFVDEKIYRYIACIAASTRENSDIKLGLSPRGAVALAAMSKATALLKGRAYVIPEDVKYIFGNVAEHRIILSSKARANGKTASDVLKAAFSQCKAPEI